AGEGDRRAGRASVRARERRGASVLRGLVSTGAGGNRGHRAYALVRAHAGRTGTRVVDRGCGADPGVDGAQTEDGCARCGALAGLAVERSLPAHLAADAGGARSAATGVASAEAGVDAECGGQPAARLGHGRRGVSKEEAVHEERPGGVRKLGARSLGESSPAGVAEDARCVGPIVAATGSRGAATSRAERGGGAADDASRSRAGDLAGFRTHHRSGGTFRTEQASGELLGTESARTL